MFEPIVKLLKTFHIVCLDRLPYQIKLEFFVFGTITAITFLLIMLSKMLSPGVIEKHSPGEKSKKKESLSMEQTSERTNESGVKIVTKNSVTPCVNSNWEKFRSVLGQQDSTEKQSKRHHSNSVESSRIHRKTPRMVVPEGRSEANKTKNILAVDETKINKELTKQIAIDCEMVGIGDGTESMLARVSLVNRHGVCVYDKYVKPREKVQDYRTAVSGIRPHHLTNGEDFKVVQTQVSEILRGRLLIGHALKNDLSVLFLSHPRRHLRDTSRYKPFRKITKGNTPSLKKLASELLGLDIQSGEHNSIEDARTAMQLYVVYKNQWEKDIYSKSTGR